VADDSRSHDAVIRVYDEAGNVIETHEQGWRFQRIAIFTRIASQFPLRISHKLIRPEKLVIKGRISARITVRRCFNVHIDTKNTKYLWVDFVVHRCRDAVY